MKNQPLPGYDYWDEHPDHPLEDWRYEVQNNDTRAGYWEWVRLCQADDAESNEPDKDPDDPNNHD